MHLNYCDCHIQIRDSFNSVTMSQQYYFNNVKEGKV